MYSLIGVCLLFLACFLPLAKLNDFIISIFPIWNNTTFEAGIWNWRDISFFAVTMAVLVVLSSIFAFRKNYAGILISALLILFIIFIIFITVMQVQTKATVYANVSFHIGWGWLSLIIGVGLLLVTGFKKTA